MNTLTLDGWCKPQGAPKSMPIGMIHFRISEQDHLKMEQLEDKLQNSSDRDVMLPLDINQLELKTPDDCGPLSDCQARVYISPNSGRGQFHLVGHRASDGSLVYTNAVMVDQLG
ncbi:hypothetical protein NO559_03970 [Dasania sp. GY-MA-18]|uniref:Uncharacterized protein n=1 Tax=Dasania phycosphaerae TaxID=2950436 RepID=A0A9J6RK25_9GAMM|nr:MULTISPECIES: hypothetical protein [Dasania]MCR8921913.1 hypothetical protein [Dasania sp. GY-MA-18]MCZ0864341.1 hypothetical protein [Dasania phycosphaerae]MCZ0868069.1 hypothetical protein [Dasania phycosphaerae]